MAPPYPFPDGPDRRRRPADRLRRTMFNVVAFGAFAGAPVATVSLWLLLTDPAVAAEVAESGSMLPVVQALLSSIGRTLSVVLSFL
jgi:uncharacterized membrane protein